jgi:tetratricopeptide (TPR) repeat protein
MHPEHRDELPLATLIAEQRQQMELSLNAVARGMHNAAQDEGNYSLATRQAIHGYERGRIPSKDSLRWLATSLGLPAEKVQAAARRQRATREMARAANALASSNGTVAMLTGPVDLNVVEGLRRELSDAITEGAMTSAGLDDWEQTVLRYGRATRDRPAGVLLVDLTMDLVELKRAFGRYRSASAVRRLTRVTAQMAGLMCLTLIKMDERRESRGWGRMARTAALEAGDPLTHSWVLAQEAYGHYYSGNLTDAVEVARHAQDVVRNAPCVGAALAAPLEARACAALGRHQETRGALQQAERILENLDGDSVVASAFGYNEAQLRFHEGNAYTHLHDTRSAWEAQERALELCPPTDFMDRALTQLDHGSCLAHDGDIATSMSYAIETLVNLSDQQRRGLITLRAREIVAGLSEEQQALPPVREFRDLIGQDRDEGAEASWSS